MGSHRINIGLASFGALLLGAALWAFRKVHADPAHHIKAHVDSTFTYGAYFMWGVAVLLLLGFFGVLDFAAWTNLFKKTPAPEPAAAAAPAPEPVVVVVPTPEAPSVDPHAPTVAMPATPTPEPPPATDQISKWTD